MVSDPTRRPRERRNVDIEQDTGTDERVPERVPEREGETGRTVEPEDEDRRVRPGEKHPAGTMP